MLPPAGRGRPGAGAQTWACGAAPAHVRRRRGIFRRPFVSARLPRGDAAAGLPAAAASVGTPVPSLCPALLKRRDAQESRRDEQGQWQAPWQGEGGRRAGERRGPRLTVPQTRGSRGLGPPHSVRSAASPQGQRPPASEARGGAFPRGAAGARLAPSPPVRAPSAHLPRALLAESGRSFRRWAGLRGRGRPFLSPHTLPAGLRTAVCQLLLPEAQGRVGSGPCACGWGPALRCGSQSPVFPAREGNTRLG